MEAFFIFLLFVFVFIIFIILLNLKSSNSFNQQLMLKKIDKLSRDLDDLKIAGIKTDSSIKEKEQLVAESKVPEQQKMVQDEFVLEENKKEELKSEPLKVESSVPLTTSSSGSQVYKKEILSKPKKKTDFEKLISESLLPKIGILLLVIALIFLGKYAVDKELLGDTAKVVAIIVVGGVLIFIAHRLRINYKTFSSILAGGGIASLYIAIAVGFQLYHLFSQQAAFIILIVITILAVMLSLAYDKKELAVIAIFGGFATPLMVSTGQGNYKILFTYILILDIGMLVLSYFKKWNLVNIVANFATVILFSAWLGKEFIEKHTIPHLGALLFVSAFYLVFFLMNVINNIKENSKFTAFEFIMVITNTFLYYWAGMVVMKDFNSDYMGLYTICLAIFNFAFAVPLYRREQIDKNLVFLLIGLVLTFASIAVPVQFKGNYITLFWAAEMVLLLWLSQQSGLRIMKLASYIVSGLMIISLAMDWQDIYYFKSQNLSALPVIINKGFITGIVSVFAILINIVLLRKDSDYLYNKNLNSGLFSGIYLVLFFLTLYIVCLLEIGYQVDIKYSSSDLSFIALACYHYFYVLTVLIWASWKKVRYIIHGLTFISIFSILIYIIAVAPDYKHIISTYLIGESWSSFALLHYLTGLFTLALCFYLWRNVSAIYHAGNSFRNLSTWFAIVIGIIILSFELDYVVLHLTLPKYDNMYSVMRQNHLIGFPILWGLIAFVMLFIGINKNEKNYRIIGISLFFFTILKLLVVDVWDMPSGGRVVAFLSLSVLLLLVSYLYLRYERSKQDAVKIKSENESTD